MTKEVLLTISGVQSDAHAQHMDQIEPVEVITPAEYYFRDNMHYLLYDEVDPDDHELSHNILTMKDNYMCMVRKGSTQTRLVIESGKRNVTYYATPFGSLHILLDGRHVEVESSEQEIDAVAGYGLEINYENVADCLIRIRVQPRDTVLHL